MDIHGIFFWKDCNHKGNQETCFWQNKYTIIKKNILLGKSNIHNHRQLTYIYVVHKSLFYENKCAGTIST
jgi:hypothetical protein